MPKLTRDEKREQTRTKLVDAARRLLAERGLADCSLDEICAEAGLTRGAFHYNFASREELVAAALAVELEHRSEELGQPFAEATTVGEWEAARQATLDISPHRWEQLRQEALVKVELALYASRHPELQPLVGRLFALSRQRAGEDLARLLEIGDLELLVPFETIPMILRAFEDGVRLQHLADPESMPLEFAAVGGNLLVEALAAHFVRPRHRGRKR